MVKQVTNTKTKPRFGDARDAYLKAINSGDVHARNPCTSKSLSTMPRRQRPGTKK